MIRSLKRGDVGLLFIVSVITMIMGIVSISSRLDCTDDNRCWNVEHQKVLEEQNTQKAVIGGTLVVGSIVAAVGGFVLIGLANVRDSTSELNETMQQLIQRRTSSNASATSTPRRQASKIPLNR